MALISIIKDFQPQNDETLLEKAAQLTPVLHHTTVKPVSGQLPHLPMGRGAELLLDFGRHLVGYLTLDLSPSGSHPDAPAFLKLTFAETLRELREDSTKYNGWVSRSWIQEEYIHVDVLPTRLRLSRRYAFRYLKITVLDTSPKYQLVIGDAACEAETSADWQTAKAFPCTDPLLRRIHAVSLKTLADCMQAVFEDGPKRDRRLWMGDFRLQALTNYVSFQNYDLVKRCLYLFGGSRFPDGRVSACLFTAPTVAADDTFLFDYAMLYPVALEEYLRETGDTEALDDLYSVAMDQIEYGLGQCDARNIIRTEAAKDTFIDWCEEVDKTACAQAVLIYAMDYATKLAERKGDCVQAARLKARQSDLRTAAMAEFWNGEQGCFLSNGQASAATQIWMVLADIPAREQAVRAMQRVPELNKGFPMQTPYIHHYYVMALLKAGLQEEAITHLKTYWGSMLDAGADTFWEAWDPDDPGFSPYGGSIINSYCHAWSCTPADILQKHLLHT